MRESDAKRRDIVNRVHDSVRAELGLTEAPSARDRDAYNDYYRRIEIHPEWAEHERLCKFCEHIGTWYRHMRGDRPGWIKAEIDFWCTATVNGRLYFHPPDAPVRVWAVSIGPGGFTWAEAEVAKITRRNVMVRYAGELARLDRRALWHWWTFWRRVRFVSSRTGRIAAALDQVWHDRYGHAAGGVPSSLQMPLADAMALLGVPADYTRDDVLAAFRREAKKAHPDKGGTAAQFRRLVEARDRLLTALGTSAPAPKMPTYAPKGESVIYRRVSGSRRGQLGSPTRLLR